MPPRSTLTAEQRGIIHGYRSGFEARVQSSMAGRGVLAEYEALAIPYVVPARATRYSPDFLLPNGIVVETKGIWAADDRKKIGLIRAAYPALQLRMVFERAKARISKTSKTTYAGICAKLGVPWAERDVPDAWLNEPPHVESLALVAGFRQNRSKGPT